MTALGQPDVLQAVSANLTADPAERVALTRRHAQLLHNALGRLTQLADAASEVRVAVRV